MPETWVTDYIGHIVNTVSGTNGLGSTSDGLPSKTERIVDSDYDLRIPGVKVA